MVQIGGERGIKHFFTCRAKKYTEKVFCVLLKVLLLLKIADLLQVEKVLGTTSAVCGSIIFHPVNFCIKR